MRGEFAEAIRQDIGRLLLVTVPDVEERELLMRMSLAVGPLTFEDIASIASVPAVIRLPAEKVRHSTGLWLQQVGSGRYLRSPLISARLAEALNPETRSGVHFVLAMRILSRKKSNPSK